jgi:hypothetical protein
MHPLPYFCSANYWAPFAKTSEWLPPLILPPYLLLLHARDGQDILNPLKHPSASHHTPLQFMGGLMEVEQDSVRILRTPHVSLYPCIGRCKRIVRELSYSWHREIPSDHPISEGCHGLWPSGCCSAYLPYATAYLQTLRIFDKSVRSNPPTLNH